MSKWIADFPEVYFKDEQALQCCAQSFSHYPSIWRHMIGIQGPLGAGKTTFVRSFLQALGVRETIKSPTYTLMEIYTLPSQEIIIHTDWYRLQDPQDWLSLSSAVPEACCILVEWPNQLPSIFEKQGYLNIELGYAEIGRRLKVHARAEGETACIKEWLKGSSILS